MIIRISKPNIRFALCGAAMVCVAPICNAAALEFTADNTEIAVPSRACGPVQLAAEEMTNFLSRVFGAPVPLVTIGSPSESNSPSVLAPTISAMNFSPLALSAERSPVS